jgi:hypothetical protein
MEISKLALRARGIWGQPMQLKDIVVALGVVYGDICRWARDADKDKTKHTDDELKKELGNVIFSTIRWCSDLGYNPEECINRAIDAQEKFQK